MTPDRAGADDDDGDRVGARALENGSSEVSDHEEEEGQGHQAQDDGRRDLAQAVAVAEVDDDCPTEQQQQSRGGQGADHGDERADEQAEDGEDLQECRSAGTPRR